MKKKVIALVPAYNEENRIKDTLISLSQIDTIERIYVVDDASSDSTADNAEASGAEVIRLRRNLGKGKALNTALSSIENYDVLLLIDCDLGESAKEAYKLIDPVVNEKADMAIADFPKPQVKGGFGLVKGLASWGIKKYGGLSVKEPLSGQRAISKEVMQAVGKFDGDFGVEVGLTIDAARKGFKVIEVDTKMSHAETGRNLAGFVHRGKQFYHVLKAIIRRLG